MTTDLGRKHKMLVIGSKAFYERVFSNRFKENFDLIYFDHLGFVPNPFHLESCYSNLGEIVVEIEHFRRNRSLERFLVFGHSGHAYLALEYAKAFPHRVEGLVLNACAPDLSPASHLAAELYFHQNAEERRKQVFAQDMSQLEIKINEDPSNRFVHFVLAQKAKNWFDLDYNPAWLWEGVSTHLPTLDFVWGKLFAEYQMKIGLEKLTSPVLMIQGVYDFAVGPTSLWDEFLPCFSNLQFKVLTSSGHYPMLEEPEVFFEELVNWMDLIA